MRRDQCPHRHVRCLTFLLSKDNVLAVMRVMVLNEQNPCDDLLKCSISWAATDSWPQNGSGHCIIGLLSFLFVTSFYPALVFINEGDRDLGFPGWEGHTSNLIPKDENLLAKNLLLKVDQKTCVFLNRDLLVLWQHRSCSTVIERNGQMIKWLKNYLNDWNVFESE